jgi:hypothetical protein
MQPIFGLRILESSDQVEVVCPKYEKPEFNLRSARGLRV